MEVGSSNMQTLISKAPRVVEFTHTYEKEKKQIFAPKSTKSVSTLDTIAKETKWEERLLKHQIESPLHKHDEQAPIDVDMEE